MEIPTIDVSSVIKEITTQLTEDYENFVYETITPYCENVTQMKVNKEELKRILLLGIQADTILDKLIAEIEAIKEKDVLCEYAYVRCIEKIKELKKG